MTWALGDNQARAFVGNIKAEKIAQGAQVIWTRVAAKNPSGVANSNTEAQLSWTDDAGIELQFVIERALDPAFTVGLTTLTVGQNQQALIDNSLSHDTTYYYRVKGDYPAGQVSDFSDVVTITTLNLVAPPTPVSATGTSNTSISLAWVDNSNNEDGFKIERSTSSTGPFTEIADLPSDSASYNDVGLTYNTTYHYRIIGYNADDTSSPATLSATTTNDLLSPSGLTASPTSNSTIDLNWQDNTVNEDGFKIARSTDGVNYTDIDTVASNVTTYTDSGLTFNTTYHYEVRGYNTSGDSNTVSASATTTNSLSAPSNLIATPTSNTTVSVSWTDTSNNEDGFTLQRATGNGAYGHLADLAAGTTTFFDVNLTPNYTYHYQIRSYNADGTSSFTPVTVTTLDELTAPTITSATVVSHEQVDVSWTDTNTNEDSFELEFSSDGGANYSSATNSTTSPVTSSTYSHVGLTQATTYQWRIRAKNTNGTSAWSTAVSATTQAGMNAPQIDSANQLDRVIRVTIGDNTSIEDGFTVERSSTSATSGFAAIAQLPAETSGNNITYDNSYNDPGANLTAGATYYYRVKADSSQYGDSPYSNVAAVTFNPLAATTTATSNFIGQNDLGFDFAETTGQTMPTAGFSTFYYELATDSNFSSISKTITSPALLASVAFSDLTPDTTYYARLRITGLLETSVASAVNSGAIITNPCASATISILDDGDSTQTVTVTSARPNSLITISEYSVSSGIRGSFSTLAEDQNGDPFLGVIRSAAADGGKITVDGGMLKYVSYLPPSIVSTYGNGAWWGSHSSGIDIGGIPRWSTSEETFLAGGGSIYDSSSIPAQWSFLYNNINYISRSTNKTNKILYINDYKNAISGSSDFPYYGAHKFYHGFKYISEYAGYTFDQLPVNTGPGNTWLHYDAIENLHSTTQQWTDYFNNYDLIIYVGVNGHTNGYSSSIAYLPQEFIDGFLNFIDGGGGSYITTDHEPVFPIAVNQILSNYGIFATGFVDRTSSDSAYQISTILADQTYIPQGWHPLFSGLDVNSYIFAGNSEAIIEYNTGQDTTNYPIISTTSNHTADASGNATISAHSSGVNIGSGNLFVSTADGCSPTVSSTSATNIYIGDNDLGFSYTTDTVNTGNTFIYELSSDASFSNIVKTSSSAVFLSTNYFTGLTSNTSYWSRLRVTGDSPTAPSSAQSSAAVITDTCGGTSYSITQSSGTRTVAVSGLRASSGFYLSQDLPLRNRNYTLASGDGANYTFSGEISGSDPALHAFSGETLSFTNNTGGHPLAIKDSSNNIVATESAGTLNWTPSSAGEYTYYCTLHSSMSGSITITPKIGLSGVTRPLALDENDKPLVSIASSGVSGGGSIIVDSSHFKFTSYLPGGLTNYGSGQYWGSYNHESNSRWTATHKSALDSGASIYDSSQIPAHWGYFANSLVSVARKENPTGKLLYIHDMKTSHTNAGTGGHYGSQRFVTAIEDISSYLGFTFEQLPTTVNTAGNWLSHANSIETLHSTKEDWLNYFNQYDVIYYIGWSGRDTRLSTPHWRDIYAYLPDVFVDAITTYVNQGGGIFMSGGSPEASCQASNQILTRFGGIVSDFSVRDDANDPAYQIQTIISNNELIPQGWSSIFSGVDQAGVLPVNRSLLSTITANEGFVQEHDLASTPSEAIALYPVLGKNSSFVASAGGSLSTTIHEDSTAIDAQELIYAVTANGCSPEYAITNSEILYVSENSLGFSFGSTTKSASNTYIYELSTTSDFSTIESSYTSPLFLKTNTFANLTSETSYYARLRITGDIPTEAYSAIPSDVVSTNPCAAATIDVVNDGDGTKTINISGLPANSGITVIEDVVGTGYRGVFRPLVEDEYQKMWIGVGQSAAIGGGRLVIDSGWPKYIGYIPQEINNYGSGTWWNSSAPDTGGVPKWLTSHKTFLDNGGSIYDSANIPPQFAYFYNAINYVRRSSNPTGKILYVNDYFNGTTNGSTHSYYAAQKFHSTVEDITQWAGYTFEQCPYNVGSGSIWSHGAFLNGTHANSPSDAAGWKAFFDQYDAVVWFATNGGTTSSAFKYLSADFLTGIHDSIDDGLGFFCSTDHEPYFMQTINQVVSSYGILLDGSINRTNNADEYKISNILSGNPNIPQGWHPLFNGLDLNSYIYAGNSESEIVYNTGQDTAFPVITKTSNYISNADGTITITAHDDGTTPIGTGQLFISTADGCQPPAVDCSTVAFNISVDQSTLISTVSVSNALPSESVTIEETNGGIVKTSTFSTNSAGSLNTNIHDDGQNIGIGSIVITTASGCSFTSADATLDTDYDGVPDAFDSDPNNPLVFSGDADGDGVDTTLDPDDSDATVAIVTPTSEGSDNKVYPMNYAVVRSVNDYAALTPSYGTNATGTPSGGGASSYLGGTYCSRFGGPGPRSIPLLAQGEKYCVNLLTDGTGENNAMGSFEWFDFGQNSCAGNKIASPVFSNIVCDSEVWRSNRSTRPAYSFAVVTLPFWKTDGTLFAAPFEYGGNYPLFATQAEAQTFSKNGESPLSFTFDDYRFGVNVSPDPSQGSGRADSDFPTNASFQANMQKQVTFWMPGGLERAVGTTPPRSFFSHYWVPNDGGAKHPHSPVWAQTVGDTDGSGRYYPYHTVAPDQSAAAQVWPFLTDMFKFDYPADTIAGAGVSDLDSDGIIDIIDSDKDNDGYEDSVDADPLNPYVFTGDGDGDGVDTTIDPDDSDSDVGIYTSTQVDPKLYYDFQFHRSGSYITYSHFFKKNQVTLIPALAQGKLLAVFSGGFATTSGPQGTHGYQYLEPRSVANPSNYTTIQGDTGARDDYDPYPVTTGIPVEPFFRVSIPVGSDQWNTVSSHEWNIIPIPYFDQDGSISSIPFEWAGYYPLYSTEAEAQAASPGGTAHSHNFSWDSGTQNDAAPSVSNYPMWGHKTLNITKTFWMPNGLSAADTSTPDTQYLTHFWHGNHPGLPVWSEVRAAGAEGYTIAQGYTTANNGTAYEWMGPQGGNNLAINSSTYGGVFTDLIYPSAIQSITLTAIKNALNVTVT